MIYSDEQLCAFLDGELNDTEASAIRDALAEDEAMADRLAELASVDTVISETYGAINREPLPEHINTVISGQHRDPSVGVSAITAAKHRRGRGRWLAAVAATVVLGMATLFTIFTNHPASNARHWGEVATVLETRASGTHIPVTGGLTIEPRLTFRNREGSYCRLFTLSGDGESRENLACRESGQWQPVATVQIEAGDATLYRPASGGSPLDALVDRALAEGPYDREQEADLIGSGWEQGRRE